MASDLRFRGGGGALADDEDAFGESTAGLRDRRRQPPQASDGAAPRAWSEGGAGLFEETWEPQSGRRMPSEDDDEEDEAEERNWEMDAELRRSEPAAAARRAKLSFFFVLLLVVPGGLSAFFTIQDWLRPLVVAVSPGDAATTQQIFFGGNPWLVSCVTAKSLNAEPSRLLRKTAELLRAQGTGIRVARVPCWEPLETRRGPQTLARRFGFRDRPPVVLASAGSGPPALLAAKGLSAEQLAAQALAAVHRLRASSSGIDGGALPREAGSTGGPRRKRDVVGRRPREMEDEEVAAAPRDGMAQAADAAAAPQEEEVEVEVDLDT